MRRTHSNRANYCAGCVDKSLVKSTDCGIKRFKSLLISAQISAQLSLHSTLYACLVRWLRIELIRTDVRTPYARVIGRNNLFRRGSGLRTPTREGYKALLAFGGLWRRCLAFQTVGIKKGKAELGIRLCIITF